MKTRLLLKWLGTAVSLALLAGCGTDVNTRSTPARTGLNLECQPGSISGAGSTFVQTIVQQWIKDYAGNCPGATINYQGVGSGAGVQQFVAGTVDFAGSDVPLKPSELEAAQARYGEILQIPWSAGGIAVEYNLSDVENLQLSPSTLAAIFTGAIPRWNDPRIAADNPGVDLPGRAIQVIHRSDGAGTTASFTAYLAEAAPEVWTFGSAKDIAWPTGQGAKGSDGVTAAVKATDGAIGYSEVSFAKAADLGMAKIRNEAGRYVSPDTPGAVTAAIAEAGLSSSLEVDVNYAPIAPEAYPISTVTYVFLPRSPADPQKAGLLESFVAFALTRGQESAAELEYSAIPEELAEAGVKVLAPVSPAGVN